MMRMGDGEKSSGTNTKGRSKTKSKAEVVPCVRSGHDVLLPADCG